MESSAEAGAGWAAAGRSEGTHLVLQRTEPPGMRNPARAVERGDRFRPGPLAARGMHPLDRHVRVNRIVSLISGPLTSDTLGSEADIGCLPE